MDDWSPEQQLRNKRTFSQMSQLLHPLRNQNPFIASSPHPLPDPSTFALVSSFNMPMPQRAGQQQHHSNGNPPENMAHRRLPMPSLQPSLQHQASRTVIDLTDDNDVPSSQPRRSSQRSAAPPQLERSDSISLGQGQEVITIDSDDDDEIEFVSEQPRPEAARQQNRAPPQHPGLRLQNTVMAPVRVPQNRLPPRQPRDNGFGHLPFAMAAYGDHGRLAQMMGLPPGGIYQVFGVDAPPRMPGVMDYGREPFPRAEPRKEEFVPPPPAREGFTRSPKEDDIVVCPACDEELMVDPMDTEIAPEKKPEKRKKSKADRAEHPFWVVRECGHVYCNKCYQKRKPDAKSPKSPFPQATGTKKAPICAVDGCDQEVGDKKHWVGVFL